ncbi:MAG: hypothetical protein U0441_03790 [Polyangiaceae bacterium]
MRRSVTIAAKAAILGSFASIAFACGPAQVPPPTPNDPPPAPAPTATAAASATATAQEEPQIVASEKALLTMLARVSKVRGLPVLTKVNLKTLGRAPIEQMLRKKAEDELPPAVLVNQTESMVALGLVRPDYDAMNGMFQMLGASIAGFYEPADKTMYLVKDLSKLERDTTLAHELVHALQDQHYALGPLLAYRPDADEMLAAGHALAEGDATAAMVDVASDGKVTLPVEVLEEESRRSIEQTAADVPVALRESLIAPYIDGYAFVQALRARGGYAAVDAAWKSLPATTEQILHLDKYDAHEAAIPVADPSFDALADAKKARSFKPILAQVLGEQGLRIVFQAWGDTKKAAVGAAGWGGDRCVLAEGEGSAAGERALACHFVFDTEEDAKEAAKIFSGQAHGDCLARPDTGPFAWSRKNRDIALAMGPYLRSGKTAKPTGTCKEAKAWLGKLLTPPPAKK